MQALEIRNIVRHKNFFNEYQPLWNLENNSIFAYEAFIRSKQVLNPVTLFQEARNNRCLYELDTSSISNAISEFPVTFLKQHFLFLNIFPSTIIHPDFPNFIKRLLNNYPSIKNRVVFEINEDSNEEPYWTLDMFSLRLKFLKAKGFKIAFDDFVLTDLSLKKITEYSPNYIKLDRSFSDGLPNSTEKQNKIHSLLAKMEKEMKLVLEGIETEEELQAAKNLGIPLLQGYYISRPKRL